MRKLLFLIAFGIQAVLLPTQASANEGFPGRAKYPQIPVFEMEQLAQNFDKVTIVDTRSSYEFSTLRIKGAVNIPVANKNFEDMLAELRSKTQNPIVFYCNGRTCMKSYIASIKAGNAKIHNTYAYDAGVFEWAQAHPDKAVLLGKSPMNPQDIIPKTAYKERCLEPVAFNDMVYNPDNKPLVVDVRDKYQRGGGVGYFPGKERWASLDEPEKLIKYINKAKKENRTLLIYDEVGKQARWVQYALQKENLQNYYFMNEGARNYHNTLINQ